MAIHVAIARFDDRTTEALDRYKADLTCFLSMDGTGEWPPHLTLGSYENLDPSKLCAWAEEYAGRCSRISLKMDTLGVFCRSEQFPDTEVIFVAPSTPPALCEFHYGFHEKYDELFSRAGWDFSLKKGQPTFHSTVVVCKTTEFHIAMDYLRENFKPLDATIEAIEIYEVPMKFIGRYPLATKPAENSR